MRKWHCVNCGMEFSTSNRCPRCGRASIPIPKDKVVPKTEDLYKKMQKSRPLDQ